MGFDLTNPMVSIRLGFDKILIGIDGIWSDKTYRLH